MAKTVKIDLDKDYAKQVDKEIPEGSFLLALDMDHALKYLYITYEPPLAKQVSDKP